MQMTDSYAAAVAVTIPILALAAGGEARAIRERIQKPNDQWESTYREHQRQRPLDLEGPAESVLAHLTELPRLPLLFRLERAAAVLGAVVWLAVFSLLTLVELLTLLWLADGDPPGHGGLAAFALWSILIGFLALIVAPMAYLVLPVMLALDLLPAGLRASLTAQVATGKGKQVAKDLGAEAGSAFNRAVARIEEQHPGKTVHVGPRQFARLMKEQLAEPKGEQTPAEGAAETSGNGTADELR